MLHFIGFLSYSTISQISEHLKKPTKGKKHTNQLFFLSLEALSFFISDPTNWMFLSVLHPSPPSFL